jgi:hypothetical protein
MNTIAVFNKYVIRSSYRFRLIKQPSSDHQNMYINYYKEIAQDTDNNYKQLMN